MKVCVFSGSRSDFDRLRWVCREIDDNPHCKLQLIVGNAHLSAELGMTIRQVHETGLPIAAQVKMLLSSHSRLGIAKSVGRGITRLAR